MDLPYLTLAIIFVWLFFTHYGLYAYTGAWYYLVTLSGAALSVSYLLVRDRWEFAGLLISIGRILLAAGVASTITFGARCELKRLRASSWKGGLLGSVPEQMRKQPIDLRNGIMLTSLSLFFAFILYKSANTLMAINLAVAGVVAAFYSLWCLRRKVNKRQ
jgi:hypothetical protein